MLRVGLTGGTGAGKSTVARRLAELGAVVIDADRLAREVVAPGTAGLDAVVAQFGDAVLQRDGSLDRAALAATVFGDPSARRTLEEITHPRIAARTAEIMAEAAPDAVVVHDVPLLVEKGMGPNYHLVVVVAAPADVRVARLVAASRMTEHDAQARVSAQATDEQRRAAADVWLENTGTEAEAHEAVDRLWMRRLVPFEENVRRRVAAPRSGTARLVPYDAGWPAAGDRLVARVRRAAGDRALSVEHVGSTAVPGLPAKDVVDLQLVVPSLAVAADVQPALEAAGFARMPGEWWDDEPAGRAAKQMHCSCDPGRPVNLHVRRPGWTSHLQVLFRDWLRAHPEERDTYAAVKARGEGLTIDAYVEAKGPWIRQAYGRAERWATATGWTSPGT